MLSERTQTQKATDYIIFYMKYPEQANPQRQRADWCSGKRGVESD